MTPTPKEVNKELCMCGHIQKTHSNGERKTICGCLCPRFRPAPDDAKVTNCDVCSSRTHVGQTCKQHEPFLDAPQPPLPNDWEKEFEEWWDKYSDYHWVDGDDVYDPPSKEQIKSFIRTIEARAFTKAGIIAGLSKEDWGPTTDAIKARTTAIDEAIEIIKEFRRNSTTEDTAIYHRIPEILAALEPLKEPKK